MISLESANFHSRFVDELPGEEGPARPRAVQNALYSLVKPTPVRDPKLLAWSKDLALRFGIEPNAALLAGNFVPNHAKPFAARYGGHQFGNWAGQLGDGRAITLGELADSSGKLEEFQLKGSGLTPYSRGADGRAVLRSSLREYVCSEAMFALGVPTTRALSLVATGESVMRDMFYDGRPAPEPGAVVCRVAPTFVRFGSFQILVNEPENMKRLADHVIQHHYPGLDYVDWFAEICRRTARMVVEWMRVGFVHGVMNTDNMSILGLTIDYGPYGWIDDYDLSWTPNTTDLPGKRYCFGRQPDIAMWNCAQLGNALTVILPGRESELQSGLDEYLRVFEEEYGKMRAAKLGLEGDVQELATSLDQWLQEEEADMTLFYRSLSTGEPLHSIFYREPSKSLLDKAEAWMRKWRERVSAIPAEDLKRRMIKVNPLYVPRNYLLQEAIDAANADDLSKLEALMEVLKNPYVEQPEERLLLSNGRIGRAIRRGARSCPAVLNVQSNLGRECKILRGHLFECAHPNQQ